MLRRVGASLLSLAITATSALAAWPEKTLPDGYNLMTSTVAISAWKWPR